MARTIYSYSTDTVLKKIHLKAKDIEKYPTPHFVRNNEDGYLWFEVDDYTIEEEYVEFIGSPNIKITDEIVEYVRSNDIQFKLDEIICIQIYDPKDEYKDDASFLTHLS